MNLRNKPQGFQKKTIFATLGCPVGSAWINGDRINGIFHLLVNGVYWGYNLLILTFDPNFAGHASRIWDPRLCTFNDLLRQFLWQKAEERRKLFFFCAGMFGNMFTHVSSQLYQHPKNKWQSKKHHDHAGSARLILVEIIVSRMFLKIQKVIPSLKLT